MDKQFVEALVALVARSDISELEFSDGERRIKIARATASSQSRQPSGVVSLSPIAEPPALARRQESPCTDVAAMAAGVFYRSPSPSEPAFANVGDLVEEGQTIGLIEAMKMLNPVEAPCRGRIARILFEDGSTVSRGAVLLSIDGSESIDV